MILRIWHGYTTPESADPYEALLKCEIFHGIEGKALPGFSGIELLRRDLGEEVEFITMMRFASIEDVKAFTGEDYETAYVPDAARKVLKRFDARSQHYDLRESRTYETRTGAAA
jgi:antibiotic biosynthesis monooxygenase (ABM) superfamily enzyme